MRLEPDEPINIFSLKRSDILYSSSDAVNISLL